MNGGGAPHLSRGGFHIPTMKDPPVRLEGAVIQNRSGPDTSRYLVMDFEASSFSVYRKPPPKDESEARSRRSLQSKIKDSVSNRLSTAGLGSLSELSSDSLAHISRLERNFNEGVWDPKFTLPKSIPWKIRDVENDETLFYLVLPSDYKKQIADAELLTKQKDPKSGRFYYKSFLRLQTETEDDGSAAERNNLPIIEEGREDGGGPAKLSSGSSKKAQTNDTSEDASTISSTSRLFKSKKGCVVGEEEVVLMFRVLLDGNEKFIWLQAAAEMGRLCTEPHVNLYSATVKNSVNVTKKLLQIPNLTGGRTNATAIRYAEWARLIDQNKNVSKLDFDVQHVHEPQARIDDDGLNATRLVKVIPTYAYRNRRMTEKDLYNEMTTTSEKWEDFRGQPVGDRTEEMIGSLHAEVLACHGLPKLDKLSSTDAVCYFICGPYAFATDVIDGFMSPVWPSKSRRACIFPLFQAYQKLFVGVFDDDGAMQQDDFAGRVVVDIARLRPNSVYDVFLPLRMFQNMWERRPRGVIHLRLRVEWDNEKKALLSYLKLPKKTDALGNAVTLNCADYKGFRNAVLTIQGKDTPMRYKQNVQKGLQREMKLYKTVMITGTKEQMMDIVIYAHPLTSFCIFTAWMHCVYLNSLEYVPAYLVVGLLCFLVRNYFKYGVNATYNCGFTPITLSEIFRVLLFGGQGTTIIKPLKLTSLTNQQRLASGSSDEDSDEVFDIADRVKTKSGFIACDHHEYPFSESGRYPKKSLPEACVDSYALFEDEDEKDEQKVPRIFKSVMERSGKGVEMLKKPKVRDDDDRDEEEAFGLNQPTDDSSVDGNNQSLHDAEAEEDTFEPLAPKSKVPWKRTKLPTGLPEQDINVKVKARKTFKEELHHNKGLMHKYTCRLFDDRMYIINQNDPGYSPNEEYALNEAIGTYKYNSPIIARMAEFIAPALEMLKIGLSMYRAGFNLLTWRDPFLTSLFFLGNTVLLCVLLVFPWRLLFFVTGVGAVGPQNYLLRLMGKLPPKKKKKKGEGDDASVSKKSRWKSKKQQKQAKSAAHSNRFEFHNHITTMGGIDRREKISDKSTNTVHRAVVPNTPLISRRFYDWPPNPTLSKVDVYSKKEKSK